MFDFVANFRRDGKTRMNWIQLSRLLPGRTPRQCYREYTRLVQGEAGPKREETLDSFIVDPIPTRTRHSEIVKITVKVEQQEAPTELFDEPFVFIAFEDL